MIEIKTKFLAVIFTKCSLLQLINYSLAYVVKTVVCVNLSKFLLAQLYAMDLSVTST